MRVSPISTVSGVLVSGKGLTTGSPGKKEKCVNMGICDFTDIKGTLHIFYKNNKIYNTLYCKFHISNWFSQNASADFCRTLLSVANLWLQLTNEYSSHMNVG